VLFRSLGLNVYDPVAAKQAADQGDHRNFTDYENKIADYTQAINLDPKNAKYYLQRGNLYDIKAITDKSNLDLAIADYTRAIELTHLAPESSFGLPMPPNQFTSLLYDDRGKDYGAKGNFDQAIADFNQAINVDPTYDFPYIDRGMAFREHGDLNQAIADFTKDISFEPTYGPSYYNRGITYQRNGQNAQAVADFQTYLKLVPNASNRDQVQQLIDQLK
jgi:tetratricopeptide (TPR) repeat protein